MPGSTSQALGASADLAGGASRTRGAGRQYPARLAGRYELECPIGGGGMGIVYRAEDRFLGRTVAVKLLPLRDTATDAQAVARFEREARAAASLCHPNIVSVFDAGSDRATHFIVMEYVKGTSLADLLSHSGRLPVDHAVDLAAQIGRGLAAAHRMGIVHRDVKPANVMINESGTVKLLDFGIARGRGSTTLTQAGSVLGSLLYIAPEVALGDAAEERSDVYSLGCVLYEMVTGQPPFSGELDAAVLHQHASAQPPRPRVLADGIPQALDDLITQTLAKRATERPTAALLTQALIGSRETRRRTPRLARDHPGGARAPTPLPVLARTRSHARARLALAALTVAVVAGMGLPATASNSRNANGSSQIVASAAAVHRITGGGTNDRRSSGLMPAIAGALRSVGRLVALAAPALETPQTPASALETPPPGSHRPDSPSKAPSRGKHRAAPSKGREPETPSSEREAEAPTSVGQEAETSPVETAPAEAPTPPSTRGAPAP